MCEKWSISCRISKQRVSQTAAIAAATGGELESPEGTQEANNTWHPTAPHPSTLAWKIPWTEEPGGLQSMESRRVGHD